MMPDTLGEYASTTFNQPKEPKTLDITDLKQNKKDELKQAIINAVKDMQGAILHELPSVILMTKVQFDLLQNDPALQGMYESKDFLYNTPLNVMEVRVKND